MELRIIEQAWLDEPDAAAGRPDPAQHVARYVRLADVRGRAGQSLLVDGSGRVLTPAPFHDADLALSAAGPVARSRRLTQEALGHPRGADYVAASSPWLAAEQIAPWSDLAITYRPQPMVGADHAGADALPRAALFDVGSIALSADGQLLGLVEFRARGGGDGNPYQVIVEDVGSGRRLVELELPPGDSWDLTQLSFSPDGGWLLLSPESNPGGPLLVDWMRAQLVRLPEWLASVAWNPAAGPGHLFCAALPEDRLLVGDFDLCTTRWTPIPLPPGLLDDAVCLTSLSLTPDGTQVAGISPLAPLERVSRDGAGGGHTVVLDLRTGVVERVLPPTFDNGVERDHVRVLWAQPLPEGPGFPLAGTLQDGLTRVWPSAELTDGQRKSHRTRYLYALRDLVVAAAEGRTPVREVTPFLRALAASAVLIDPGLVEGAVAIAQRSIDRPDLPADAGDWFALLDQLRAVLSGHAPSLGLRGRPGGVHQ